MSEMSEHEKLIMITGFLMAMKSTYPKLRGSIEDIMKLLGLDKIEADYTAGKLTKGGYST